MSNLDRPAARVPIGYVMVGGQRLPVEVDSTWFRVLFGLYERAGGTFAQSNSELSASMHDDSGIEEIRAELYAARDEARQMPYQQSVAKDESLSGRLEQLEALVGVLVREIDGIKQGTLL